MRLHLAGNSEVRYEAARPGGRGGWPPASQGLCCVGQRQHSAVNRRVCSRRRPDTLIIQSSQGCAVPVRLPCLSLPLKRNEVVGTISTMSCWTLHRTMKHAPSSQSQKRSWSMEGLTSHTIGQVETSTVSFVQSPETLLVCALCFRYLTAPSVTRVHLSLLVGEASDHAQRCAVCRSQSKFVLSSQVL